MVSANTQANPLGTVVIFDSEVPRTFTATAIDTVSGGDLVSVHSGTDTLVSSGASSFASSDILVQPARDNTLFNGIALNNAGSNGVTTVATRGAYLVKAGEIVSGGALVGHNQSGGVVNWVGNASGTSVINETICGRALTTSASGTDLYSLVYFNA